MTKKKYWYKPNGYPTDHLIDSLTDTELLAHMGVPRKYAHYATTMDEFPPEVDIWMERLPYIFRPSDENLSHDMCGTGLILWGDAGTHKTTMAAAVLLRVIRKKIPNTDPTGRNYTWHGAAMGRFVDWQSASELFRNANDDDDADVSADEVRRAMFPTGDMLKRGDFLVVDDISRERATEYNVGELQRVLRRRADEGFPSIITTNSTPDQWEKIYGTGLAGYLHRSFVAVSVEHAE